MNIQRWMVVLTFLAIFLWAGREIVPVWVQRWYACRQVARAQEDFAITMQTNLTAYRLMKNKTECQMRQLHLTEQALSNAKKKAQAYRRALYIPWEFYRLGDIP